MAEAEFYTDLAKRNPREIALRFGRPFEGVDEFQAYISAAINLESLEVAWDNTCADRILRAFIDGIAGGEKASKLDYIKLWDDLRPIDTKNFDFVGLLVQLARRDNTIKKVQLGHNNSGESWWFTLQNREREQTLDLNELVFPSVLAYETFLGDVLDAAAKDGVLYLDLYISMVTKYLTYGGIKRIFEIISTKYFSLRKLSLKMTPNDNDYCEDEEVWDRCDYCEERGAWYEKGKPFPYEVVISAIAHVIENCPEIEEIDIELGKLTQEHEIASKKLADAIVKSKSLRVKRKVRLQCWISKFSPWSALPDKEWIEIPDSESEDSD